MNGYSHILPSLDKQLAEGLEGRFTKRGTVLLPFC
jgi:hypothetical protein